MAPVSLRRLALAGMAALLLGAAPLAQTPEPAQDDSIEVLRTRANAGHAAAQFNLGVAYRTGEGVPQDDVEAYKWLNLAAIYADAEQRERFAEARDTAVEPLTPALRHGPPESDPREPGRESWTEERHDDVEEERRVINQEPQRVSTNNGLNSLVVRFSDNVAHR